jgi:phage shock protein PspC (stress-responsive transcriptional regulator)
MSDYTAPQPPPTAAPQPGPYAAPRRLTRVLEGKMLAGVCTGLARYLNVDPVIVRVGFAVTTLLSGVGILLYLALWIIMPAE